MSPPRRAARARPTPLHRAVRAALEARASATVKEWSERYFKGQARSLGVKGPGVTAVIRELRPLVAGRAPAEVVAEALALLESEYLEERQVGVALLHRQVRHLGVDFIARLEPVFDRVVRDWATCDTVAGRVLRFLVRSDADARRRVVGWSRSRNLWRQRAAAVAFVNEARHGRFNAEITEVCAHVVANDARFAQLGAGWALRELSRADRSLVLEFLGARYPQISREGLRYAIEKLPPPLQRRVLAEHAAARAAAGAPAAPPRRRTPTRS